MFRYFLSASILFVLSLNAKAYENALTVLINQGFTTNNLADLVTDNPEFVDLEVADKVDITDIESNKIFKLYADKTNETYFVSKSDNNVIAVEKVKVKSFEGRISHTLFESVMKEIKNQEVAKTLESVFLDEFTTAKGLKVKTSFDFEIEEFYVNNSFKRYGNILRASLYIGEARSTKVYLQNRKTGEWGLFPEHSDLIEKPFYSPVNSSRVTSKFNLNRRHPVTKRHKPHKGIDFGASMGTPIYPAMEGEVIVIARTKSKGKFVTLRHDNGFETTYIHLKKYAPKLRVGMWVDLEDQIGEVGKTGYSTGAHLHFGVIHDNYFINPIYLMKGYSYKNKDAYEALGIEERNALEEIDEELED